uniref:Uncharacterized protein n=1 Tax=Thermosporothrix sp. COM3 TaxID=2490863 RepID=A0A455T060_9CHLR|nr:hypothetical protein KTC_54750 [Thermosporothrix sp. COM3]
MSRHGRNKDNGESREYIHIRYVRIRLCMRSQVLIVMQNMPFGAIVDTEDDMLLSFGSTL